MIPDTSGQDVAVAPKPRRRVARALLLGEYRGRSPGRGRRAGVVVERHDAIGERIAVAHRDRSRAARWCAMPRSTAASSPPSARRSSRPPRGTVTLKVSAGDTVKRGDVARRDRLARPHRPAEARAVDLRADGSRGRPRSAIVARKQKLLAQRDADTAEIERVAAQRMYERIEKAGVAGVVAKNDFMKARGRAALGAGPQQARRRGRAARERRRRARASHEGESQLARQRLALDYAQRRVDELKVRAPVDGFIGSLAVADRSVVPANAPLMTLVDLSVLEVELEIPGDLRRGPRHRHDRRDHDAATARRWASCPRCRRKSCATRCSRACASRAPQPAGPAAEPARVRAAADRGEARTC